MKSKYQFIVAFLAIVVLFACENESANGSSESPAVESGRDNFKPRLTIPEDSILIKAVKDNLEGLNNEDLAWAMEPLHTNSPYMHDPAYHIRGSFLVYEMEFELHEIKIEHKSDTACTALVEHDSRNYNERTYAPTRSTQRYTWKPDNGAWKIWKMEVLGTSPL